jgi:(2R)-3-sulfolactate dehydrogenase (NADP+)
VTPSEIVAVPMAEVRTLAMTACGEVGASLDVSRSLVDATLSAAQFGPEGMGLPHLLDYLRGFGEGRIDGKAEPVLDRPLPAIVVSDARGGIAQLGFDRAFGDVVKQARALGLGVFTQKNSYTAGELGYYVRRLAMDGLIGIAATNGPALLAAEAGGKPVFCTNPLAFAAPATPPRAPLVIDQAASATAFVNIVRAAGEKRAIPEGWATDHQGNPTTDAQKALTGALLPFGGYRGANIALMVEVLSAGFAGAAWSLDAGDFRSGHESPGIGLTVIALSPAAIDPHFADRCAEHLRRLEALGVHIPGKRAGNPPLAGADTISVAKGVLDEIRGFANL